MRDDDGQMQAPDLSREESGIRTSSAVSHGLAAMQV